MEAMIGRSDPAREAGSLQRGSAANFLFSALVGDPSTAIERRWLADNPHNAQNANGGLNRFGFLSLQGSRERPTG